MLYRYPTLSGSLGLDGGIIVDDGSGFGRFGRYPWRLVVGGLQVERFGCQYINLSFSLVLSRSFSYSPFVLILPLS